MTRIFRSRGVGQRTRRTYLGGESSASNPSAPADRLEGAVRSSLGALWLLSCLAFGSVHGWASALVEIALWVLGVSWLVIGRRPQSGSRERRALGMAAATLAAYLLAQTMPLPERVISVISPATAELYRRTLDLVADTGAPKSGGGTDEPTRPSGLSAEDLGRIRDRAEAVEGGRARSLSLYCSATRRDLVLYVAYGVAFWIAATISAPRRLLALIAIGSGGLALGGLIQLSAWNGKLLWFFHPYDVGDVNPYASRVTGPFVNPDHFAALMAMAFCAGAGRLVSHWRRQQRGHGRDGRTSRPVLIVAWSFLLAILVAALIGSASRGGIIGGAIGSIVLGWGAWRSRLRPESEPVIRADRRAARVAVIFARARNLVPFALIAVIVLAGLGYAGARGRGALDYRLSATTFTLSDVNMRTAMWRQTALVVRDFPLFGVGAGCWREIFRRYERFPIVGHRPNHAHNDYLEWASEVGIVGLMLTALVFARLLPAIRSAGNLPTGERLGLLGAFTALAWHEAFDFNLRVPAVALLLAILLGLRCNPRWRELARHRAPDLLPDPTRRVRVAVLVTAAVLSWASVRQCREFIEWARAREAPSPPRIAVHDAETWYELGKGISEKAPEDRASAWECFRAALRLRPAFAEAMAGLAWASADDRQGEALLRAALWLDPTRAAWRLRYASQLEKARRTSEALAQVEEAVRLDPRPSSHPYLTLGASQLSSPLITAVERGFLRALAENPQNVRLAGVVATFYGDFGKPREAASLWERAAAAEDQFRPLRLRNAASAYARIGSYDRAELLLRRAITLDPDDFRNYRVLAVDVLRPAGKQPAAEEVLDRGTLSSADPVPLYLDLASLAQERGETSRQVLAVEKAAELRPRDGTLQFHLGLVYAHVDDLHRARAAFNRAIDLAPATASYYFHRGTVSERLFDMQAALEDYRRACSLEPANEAYQASAVRLEKQLRDAAR